MVSIFLLQIFLLSQGHGFLIVHPSLRRKNIAREVVGKARNKYVGTLSMTTKPGQATGKEQAQMVETTSTMTKTSKSSAPQQKSENNSLNINNDNSAPSRQQKQPTAITPPSRDEIASIKKDLLELLPRMTGTPEEFRSIETYVNTLEAGYQPPQTLGFLNLAMQGEWQLLFSTNLLGKPNRKLRLREMVQRIETNQNEGALTNQALWDLSEEGDGYFHASGKFIIENAYKIVHGARMEVELKDHVINLAPGSTVPKDVKALVGMLHRAIPLELFDPNELAMDTTYLDENLRIVRITGAGKMEGVRDIYMRKGTFEIKEPEIKQ